MSAKVLVFFIASLIAGFVFVGVGIYFLTPNFIKKMASASGKCLSNEAECHLIEIRAKTSGYMALSVGLITLVFAVFLLVFPKLFPFLALTYMIFLILAFAVISIAYSSPKDKNKTEIQN